MKNLKNYIKESILGDWEDIDIKKDIKSEIKQFLKDNYYGRFSMTLVDGKYIVNSKASVDIKNISITSLTNGMFEFGKVRGFNCSYCNSLTSLKGAPKEVGEDFSCAFCNSLKTLEGAPEKVGGIFNCSYCDSLKTLEGAPEEVYVGFNCRCCNSLTSLKGAPEKVIHFNCDYCESLKTLEGAPEKIDVGSFYCSHCNSLTSLKGAPKEVRGYFVCRDCKGRFTEKDVTDVCNVKGKINI